MPDNISYSPFNAFSNVVCNIEQINAGKYVLAFESSVLLPHTPTGNIPAANTSSSGVYNGIHPIAFCPVSSICFIIYFLGWSITSLKSLKNLSEFDILFSLLFSNHYFIKSLNSSIILCF